MTFVCTGNTCRSPMAEAIARRLLKDAGAVDILVSSAGVFALEDIPASEGARRAAQASGLNLEYHGSQLLTRELVERSTLILGLGQAHVERARALGAGDRARLLARAAGGSRRCPGSLRS